MPYLCLKICLKYVYTIFEDISTICLKTCLNSFLKTYSFNIGRDDDTMFVKNVMLKVFGENCSKWQ